MYCNKCGNEVTQTSIFCSNCGQKIANSKDPIIEGMEPFGVYENQPINTEHEKKVGSASEDIFQFLIFLILNCCFFAATYFTTPSLISAYLGTFYHFDSEHRFDLFYSIIYIIPVVLWQWYNDYKVQWSREVENNSLENIPFLVYIFLFIPLIPTAISFYFLTQNENLPISAKNVGVYVLSITICLTYYFYKTNKLN